MPSPLPSAAKTAARMAETISPNDIVGRVDDAVVVVVARYSDRSEDLGRDVVDIKRTGRRRMPAGQKSEIEGLYAIRQRRSWFRTFESPLPIRIPNSQIPRSDSSNPSVVT